MIPSGLSFHLVEMKAEIEAGRCPRRIQQGVRGWQWHGPGSRSLKCATTAGRGEGGGTKQSKGEIWIPQYSGHGFTRPRKFISFDRTPNPHLPKQNWTIVIMNIKSSPYPSQGPKVAWKLFPPKRLDRTWFYRAMCYAVCSFLAI